MHRGGSEAWKALAKTGQAFQDVVIRRKNPLKRLRDELRNSRGELLSERDTRTIHASPAVDVAATMELVQELKAQDYLTR